MSGCVKVAVVTGSNKGIGLAIVRSLCKQYDGTVYLTARYSYTTASPYAHALTRTCAVYSTFQVSIAVCM